MDCATRSIRRTLASAAILSCLLALGRIADAAAQQPAPIAQELTVNLLTHGEPNTLDPTRAHPADGAVVRQLFEPLLRFDENLVPQPAAAQGYDVSADGTLYTFHLRPDGRWSDGQPVTAGQFAYAWNRLLDPALHADDAPLFQDAGITSVAAPDDQTVQVHLSQPFGALPELAALWAGAPLRQDVVEANPDSWATDPATLVGNGPFLLADWAHHDHLTLVPNPQYGAHSTWPRPVLTRVTVPISANADAAYASFTSSAGPDWALVPDLDANQVLNDPVLAPQARQVTDLTTFWIQFNTARAPLDDVLVRRALSRAIDRAAVVRDLATSVGVPTTTVIPPGTPGFQAGLGHELGFDPAGARALLSQAGFASAQDLPPLTFSFLADSADLQRARYLHDQWSATLGLDVQLQPMDQPAYESALAARDYDLAFGGWTADYPDPQDWLGPLFACRSEFNTFNYCNAGFDQLVARGDRGGSLPDRLQVYAQAQAQLAQEVPVAPLFARGRLVLVKPWVQSVGGGSLRLTGLDEYPGSLFLDKVQVLPH
jgi:oligopeptide transport system substrate-binding protein